MVVSRGKDPAETVRTITSTERGRKMVERDTRGIVGVDNVGGD